jgi:hypothetical protein
MNKSLREKILEIVTYHSDDGTSGYRLTLEEVDEIIQAFELIIKECKPDYNDSESVGDYESNLLRSLKEGKGDDVEV